jgi:hypothetical protein
MYRTHLKTAVTVALQAGFAAVADPDFSGDNAPLVSVEFPVQQSAYPGVWVQYADNAEISIAGIGHVESAVVGGALTQCSRWKFSGSVSLTVVALTSLQRDRLFDLFVEIFISSKFNPALAAFRAQIEQNPFIAMNANFDDLQPFGDSAGQGTPWGTDEVVYETSASFDVIGEFLTDVHTGSLLPLSKVEFVTWVDGTTPPSDPAEQPLNAGNWNRTQWT